MSQWKLATRMLYEAGGGPMPALRFLEDLPPWALRHAADHGMVQCDGRKARAVWSLTPAGWDFAQNRTAMAVDPFHMPYRSGRPAGTGARLVATWLSALPRPGQVSLRDRPGAMP